MSTEKTLEEKFNKYISKIKKAEHVEDNDKLILYALYKQANEGDNYKDKPSILNRVEMEKWKAWNELKGLDRDIAKKRYINKVKEILLNKKNDG
jgi:diazepam-binding inhibitor (GABA receptor modulating acyl-CoA-binding protein)